MPATDQPCPFKAYARGAAHPGAKLTAEAVLAIRDSSATNAELAERFGVSVVSVSLARRGRTWRHLAGAQPVRQPPSGEKAPNSKLTADAVQRIRASDESHAALARRYGVAAPVIARVRARLTWRHIPDASPAP